MDPQIKPQDEGRLVRLAAGAVALEGNLTLPDGARGIVLFAHGSGSSRHSPRNRYVARLLNDAKLATLLIDLLTPQEEAIDMRTAHLRFDIGLLAGAALAALRVEKKLVIIPGATHLFEEPGALEAVAGHAREWFERYLKPTPAAA